MSAPLAGFRFNYLKRAAAWLALLCSGASMSAAHAQAPLEYLTSHGIRAHPIRTLTWATLIISLAVIIIISVLLLAGVVRGYRRGSPALPGTVAVARPPGGASWIYVGVGISTAVLFAIMVWTVVTLAGVSNAALGEPALRIEVTGHQWWWEVNYLSDEPSRQFTTANEIHIPTGQKVEVRLRGSDVIHSFWVPALAGKTDAIPGQHNRTWLQADRPGVYRGQCGEYCGEQHAHMAFEVIATSADEFRAWWDHQLEGAAGTTSKTISDAQNAFIGSCGICHTVRGTRAGGSLGPDLTHVMSRRRIAAAALPNQPGYLAAWISDPQHIKPGNYMPQLDLSGPELSAIQQYVQTLK